METLALTLIFAGLAFAYVLAPWLQTRASGSRRHTSPAHDWTGEMLKEEIELERAAGKLSEEEEALILEEKSSGAELDEIELEVRSRRRRLRQR
ncbi:MAG: hypothetical protein ONB23_09140 [candidate division KSB1 bacterium]|nr:hypothetical protein [candidate division KSB1 bacterium]